MNSVQLALAPLTHDDREQLITRLEQSAYAVDPASKTPEEIEAEAQANFIVFWADLFIFFSIEDDFDKAILRLQFYERRFLDILWQHGTRVDGILYPISRGIYIKTFNAFARFMLRPIHWIPEEI